MKRVVLVVAAALAACQSAGAPEPIVKDKGRAAAAPVETGGRFVARGTAGDEHELKLNKLAVEVGTSPGTVHSHLTMEVATAAEGQSEALIRMPVPRGAAVTDAVLWVNDKPMRGAFVERQRAQNIYTSIVTRRRDPALVTWDGPGWIAVSIFPLEKNRSRRLELAWIEPAAEADGRVLYQAPVVSEGERIVGRAAVTVDGRKISGAAARDLITIAPADPRKVFSRRAPGDPFQQVMVREAGAVGAPHFVLVAETSAAMSIGDRARQRAMLDSLFAELPADAKLTLLAADWDVVPIAEDVGAGGWGGALAKLDGTPSAGALHLERALHEAAAQARKTGAAAVLFVGQGVDGFGGDGLAGPLVELQDARVRLCVAATTAVGAPAALARAAVDTGGESIALGTFEDSRALLVDALRPRPGQSVLDARSDGEWHLLRTITGGAVWMGRTLGADVLPDAGIIRADAGSPLAADLASLWDRARLEWHDRDATEEIARVLTPVTSLLVLETEQDYRRFGLAVPAPVAMEEQGPRGARHKGEEGHVGLYGGLARERTPGLAEEQARNAGVLGNLRSSSDDAQLDAFARSIQAQEARRNGGGSVASIFGRDSGLGTGSQDVLGGLIGNQIGQGYGVGGVGMVGTGAGGGGTGEASIGLGNLGTIGKGGGDAGNGSGYGRGAGGLGGRRAHAPDVIPGVANVRGSLDKEIVRRIIRRHINEVKFCYEQQLVRRPSLSGRIMVQFTIDASGQVIASLLQNSTVGDQRVESCTVQAVRRWEFPRPLNGGIVIVSYPFVLTPGGAGAEEQAAGPSPPAVRPVVEALATLAKGAEAAQIERICSLLGVRRVSSPEALAWTINRTGADFETHLLVARLLERSKRHHDAVRVLTEASGTSLAEVAAALDAIAAGADAAELRRLAKR
jgi:TonB family protein